MGLVAADWVIILVLGGSCLIALFRGLVREGLSLANWVVAALVARGISGPVSQWLSQWIDTPSIQYVIAFAVLMLVFGSYCRMCCWNSKTWPILLPLDRVNGFSDNLEKFAKESKSNT